MTVARACTISAECPIRHRGFTMIEVLVTLVVLALGLLGVMGLQARGQQAELESYQRGQALVLLQDMVDRMNANRVDAHSLLYSTAVTFPVGGGTSVTTCTGAGAAFDLCDWGNELNGAAEATGGGSLVGAILGARGCITYDATTELTDSNGAVETGTGVYTVSVAWQGVAATVAPAATLTCGQNLYPSETVRRVVTATLRIADLNSP